VVSRELGLFRGGSNGTEIGRKKKTDVIGFSFSMWGGSGFVRDGRFYAQTVHVGRIRYALRVYGISWREEVRQILQGGEILEIAEGEGLRSGAELITIFLLPLARLERAAQIALSYAPKLFRRASDKLINLTGVDTRSDQYRILLRKNLDACAIEGPVSEGGVA